MNIGNWADQGIKEVSGSFGSYLLLSLVFGILSVVTLGILWGPFVAGSISVIRHKLRGQGTVDLNIAFQESFRHFLPTFLIPFLVSIALLVIYGVLIVLNLIPVLGQIISYPIGILVGLIASLLLPFYAIAYHYIMEEHIEFGSACSAAWQVVMAKPVAFWAVGIVVGTIWTIGFSFCYVGIFFTVPVALVMLALMLENIFPPR